MVKNIKPVQVRTRPIGVTILAVLGYINAVFSLIGGIAMVVGSGILGTALSMIPGYALLGALGTSAIMFVGVILIVMAVINYFVARGLWAGKNWARIVMIVFAALSVVTSIVPLNIIGLVIGAVIIWYLAFNKPAVAYFK